MDGLDKLLKPKSITVIGASDSPNRAGNVVIRNLLSSSFHGPIMPVTPKYDAVAGVLAYPTIASLPRVPDLAIVCTNAHRNVDIVRQLGEKGVKVAIVLAAGMNSDFDGSGETEEARMYAVAKQHGMRLVGPNSMGLILPWLNLNASFSPIAANRATSPLFRNQQPSAPQSLTGPKTRVSVFPLFFLWGMHAILTSPNYSTHFAATVKPRPFSYM